MYDEGSRSTTADFFETTRKKEGLLVNFTKGSALYKKTHDGDFLSLI